jgi:hypothetical protein
MLLAAFFTACDKESPVSVNEQAGNEKEMAQAQELSDPAIQQELMKPVTTQYFYQGKIIAKEEFESLSKRSVPVFTVTVAEQSDRHVAHVFDSEEALYSWAATTEFAAKFAQLREVIVQARQGKGVNLPTGKLPDGTESKQTLAARTDNIIFYEWEKDELFKWRYAWHQFTPLPVRIHDLRRYQYSNLNRHNYPRGKQGVPKDMNDNISRYLGTTPTPYPIIVTLFDGLDFKGAYHTYVHRPRSAPPYYYELSLEKNPMNNKASSLIAI